MSRSFRAKTHLTLPQGLLAGPGATSMQLEPGSVFTAEDPAAVQFQRFINGRLRAGDLEEVELADGLLAEPGGKPIAPPRGGAVAMEIPELPKKER